MQRITLVVLLVLAAGLGAFIYFYEIKGEPERQTRKEAEEKIFRDFDREAVNRMRIVNSHDTFEIERLEDKGWTLVAPRHLTADTSAAEDVLFALESMRFTHVVEEAPGDLAPFGLASPIVSLEITTEQAGLTLLVGANAPFGGATYVKRGDESKVYLTSYPILGRLNKSLQGWRDKKVASFVVSDVTRIQIEGPEGLLMDATRQDDGWRMTAQPSHRLDPSHFTSLLYDLQGLSAVDFSSGDSLETLALSPPRWTITLTTGDDVPLKRIQLGKSDLETHRIPILRAPGEDVMWVRAGIEKKLAKDPNDLRERRVVPMSPYAIRTLEATVRGEQLKAVREKDGWTISGSLSGDVSPGDVDAVLNDLTSLDATSLIDNVPVEDLDRFGLEAPDLSARLVEGSPDGGVIRELTVSLGQKSKSEETLGFARVGDDPTIYQVNRFVLTDLLTLLLGPRETKTDTGEASPPDKEGTTSTPLEEVSGGGESGVGPSRELQDVPSLREDLLPSRVKTETESQ